MFRLNIFLKLWFLRKCLQMSLNNYLPMFVLTFKLKGGLNQIIFLFRFHLVFWDGFSNFSVACYLQNLHCQNARGVWSCLEGTTLQVHTPLHCQSCPFWQWIMGSHLFLPKHHYHQIIEIFLHGLWCWLYSLQCWFKILQS